MNRHQIWVLIAVVLLSGCGSDERIIDKIGFVQSTSQDLLPDGQLKIAISVPIANPDIKEGREFLQTVAISSKVGQMKLARQTNLKLVRGQLRLILFGRSQAEQGIWDSIDSFYRDPTVSETVKIVIVDGDAASLLSKNYESFPRTGKYIDGVIARESGEHIIPKTTLYSFLRDYYNDGQDPIAPIIRSETDSIAVQGIGLFRDDKYVGEINSEEGIIFTCLYRSFKRGELTVNLTEESDKVVSVFFDSLQSKRKVKLVRTSSGNPEIRLHLKVKASVVDYPGELTLSNDRDLQEFERKVSEEMTRRGNQVIKKLQALKADSLGVGNYVRNSMNYKDWKEMNWREEYANLNITCNFTFKVKDYGFQHRHH
ncbi:Ger(x)C family spore germination protein [Paenibacillus sp. FSL W8-0186]|uniref:Ger(x)C family spore germination protein n=1 Tax=Paenibacillus sp. FSL W8-0186 TaxID=2921709 RepID=UPI0030CB3EB4